MISRFQTLHFASLVVKAFALRGQKQVVKGFESYNDFFFWCGRLVSRQLVIEWLPMFYLSGA